MKLKTCMSGMAAIAALACGAWGYAPTGPQGGSNSVTYYKDIAPLLRAQCVSCHRDGGPAPFPLDTFAQVKRHAELIRIQVLSRSMPPISIMSEVTQFGAVRPWTDKELVLYQRWIQGGMKAGSGKDISTPAPSQTSSSADVDVRVGSGLRVRAEGDPYWQDYWIQIPSKLQSVKSFSVKPASIQSFKNVAISLETSRKPSRSGTIQGLEGDVLGSWAPGYPDWKLPAGSRIDLPKPAYLRVRVHYKPTGKPEPAEVRLRFQSGAGTDHAVQWVTKEMKKLLIPADSSPDIKLEYVTPQSMRLANILPEARFFASRVQVVADFPDGGSKVVYDNYRWSPFLQGNNQIRKPILLPAGTKLRSIFSYVNDEYCQINENKKPEPVSSGPGPFDEMCRMHLLLIPE